NPAVYAAEGEFRLARFGSGAQVGLHRCVDDVEHLLGLAVDDQLHLPVAGEPLPGDLEVFFWRYLGRGVDVGGGREGGDVGLQLERAAHREERVGLVAEPHDVGGAGAVSGNGDLRAGVLLRTARLRGAVGDVHDRPLGGAQGVADRVLRNRADDLAR